MRLLTWTVNRGLISDYFTVKIEDIDTHEVIYTGRYVGEINVSYDRLYADEEKPFVADVIGYLVKKYDVMGTVGAPGIDAFTGLPVTKKDVDDFLYKYVWEVTKNEE